MDDPPLLVPELKGSAAAGAGVGLVFNATGSAIASVGVTPGAAQQVTVASFTLFPASQPTGSSPMAGCSFPIPPGGAFVLTIAFNTGQQVAASISTPSTATPALFVVAFLNGIVVAQPSGAATSLIFTRSLAASFKTLEESSP